ncbi:MAG: beta-ketoacyl-ACP synthase II [Bdellovibrionales bacterium]|nr:beta-ketoacyl-ACP synthase II [Bdellovibrionales bacterium]
MNQAQKQRVVVTGIGILSPVGNTREETWKNIVAGKSGIQKITLFDTKDCAVNFAGEVKGFDPTVTLAQPLYPRGKDQAPLTQAVSAKDKKKMDRFIHFALAAGIEAYQDSGLDEYRNSSQCDIKPTDIGINIGCGMGGLPGIEETYSTLLEKGFRRITPFFIPQVIPNLAAGHMSILLNTQNTNLCSVSACSSSAHSIGESTRTIQRGDAKIMIAGGTEAVVCALGIGGFAAMRALSTRNEAPEKASRPFDKDRDGFVMGEGSAVLVLEEYNHAKKRGAKIYGEIAGYGASSDAHHITAPLEDGNGGFRAMELALKESGLTAKDVGYINAHGTSTPLGDPQEAKATARLLGSRSDLHISSTKSMTGHLLGAAGAIEGAFTALAIRDGMIPPTINLDSLDPDCAATGLHFTPNVAVAKKDLRAAFTNSFGFGGTNVSLLIKKVD